MGDRPVDAGQQAQRRRFGFVAFTVEGADREKPHVRCGSHQLGARDDRACHAGAVWIGGAHGGDGVEAVGDGVDDLRMRRVDRGVDHRDQDFLAGGEAMRFAKMQLGRRVLRARIELGACGWYLRERRHRRLREREAIIGLGVAHHAVDLEGANDVGDVGGRR